MNRRLFAIATGVAIVCALPCSSDADRLFFARKGTLMSVGGNGRGMKRVAKLAKKRTIAAIDVTASGTALVRDDLGNWYWTDTGKRRATLTPLGCKGQATLSPNGKLVVCSGDPKVTYVHHLADNQVRMIPTALSLVGFSNRLSRELVASHQGKLWAIPLDDWDAQRLLAPHAPAAGLLVAPNGKRAVGRYSDGKHKRIFTFRLDGKAARRRLLRNADPVAWSADSKWLLAHGRTLACIVRGVGGQFKCWRKYRAVAISPDGSVAILAKRDKRKRKRIHLYKAVLKGANKAKPYLFIRNANMTAAWQAP